MASVGDIFVSLRLDASAFERGVTSAQQQSAKLGQQLWSWGQPVVLTAWTHQEPIHDNVVVVTLRGLRQGKQHHGLVPLGNVCPAISSIQQQAMAGWKVCSSPHDLLKRRPSGSGRELPIEGGISVLRQV